MKVKGFIWLLIAVFFLNSCSVKKCDVLCDSGPLSFNFELLDKTTGENLFTNGTFNSNDIKVLDLDNNNSSVEFGFLSEDDLITLGPFGWETKIANYNIKVGENSIFTLHLKTEEIEGECCSRVGLKEFGIEGAEYSQNTETGIYEVLVEL